MRDVRAAIAKGTLIKNGQFEVKSKTYQWKM
jgi:hypothetical protein